jgi:hypothetical protein
MNNQSKYDPTRKTVGAIYRDAQMSSHDSHVLNGDLTAELKSSLVCDLNETITSDPYDGIPFYITVHEKKDLQMPRAILRRMLTTKYRPYPEDDTLVFWVNPKTNDVRFCWCLPHWSEMENMLANEKLFNEDMIADIKAWKSNNLARFGFIHHGMKTFKDEKGSLHLADDWRPNPDWQDKPLVERIQFSFS